LNDTF